MNNKREGENGPLGPVVKPGHGSEGLGLFHSLSDF